MDSLGVGPTFSLIANGMTASPLITPAGLAYLVLIEVLGTIVGAVVLGYYFRLKGLDVPWEVRTIAMATAMIISWVLGMLAWGAIL